MDSSKSLYSSYEEIYKYNYPQRKIKTIRDLKNFIKDVAEEEGNKQLYKKARKYSFELSKKFLKEIEEEKIFIYKDNKFFPKGSD